MKENAFIDKNKNYWKDLENHIELFNKKRTRNISSDEIEHFLYLFRTTSHHLGYVRTYFPKSKLEKYLNGLVGNAHHHLYTVRKNPWYDFKSFISNTFPTQVNKYMGFVLASAFIFLIGILVSFLMVIKDPSTSLYFLPKDMIDIDYTFSPKEWNYAVLSSTIMVNNITVSFKAFVYGLFLGIGTIYILFINGCILGALTGLVYLNGDLVSYSALILPHGFLELTAIFIAGGAGLLLGKSILIPGKYKRLDYVVKNSKEGITLLLGVIIFLILAALIEGFFTPLPISPVIKLTFSAFTLLAISLYLNISKKKTI